MLAKRLIGMLVDAIQMLEDVIERLSEVMKDVDAS